MVCAEGTDSVASDRRAGLCLMLKPVDSSSLGSSQPWELTAGCRADHVKGLAPAHAPLPRCRGTDTFKRRLWFRSMGVAAAGRPAALHLDGRVASV